MAQNNNPPSAPTLQSILGQALQPNQPTPPIQAAQAWYPPAGLQHGTLLNLPIAAGGQGNHLMVQGNGQLSAGVNGAHKAVTPWHFRGVFPTNLFTQGIPLFAGLALAESDFIHFLLHMWITCEEPDLSTYGVLNVKGHGINPSTFEENPSNLVLLFVSEKKRDEFTTWLRGYTARFQGDEWQRRYFPGMTIGNFMSGFTFPADSEQSVANRSYNGICERWVKEWQWIVNHTHSKVLHINGYWLFENEAEMLMFKMRDKE